MYRRVVAGIVCLSMSGLPALAQNSPSPTTPESPAGAASPPSSEDAIESMADPQPGDHWTYETRDEITGVVKATTTHVVTEVSPTTIGLRIGAVGNANFAFITCDRGWNTITTAAFKYTPNDGGGIRLPLEVGKKWSFQSNDFNSAHGVTFKRSGTARVTAKESVTTRAGTFDAFKIETSTTVRSANDPTKKSDFTSQMWYVPAVNHWVKRVMTTRTDGQIRDNSSMELVEFGRK